MKIRFAALLLAATPSLTFAQQVVYSVGTQQVYDSNIFLEGDKPTGPVPTKPDGTAFEEFDGDKNDDFISNPYVSAAGRVDLSPKLVTNFNARLGFVLFSNNDRENRSTVDGMFSITPEAGVLPEHWTFFITEALTSQANAIGVAQGATTRQGQMNAVSIGGGLTNYKLSERLDGSATLSSTRNDFLGQFLFDSNDDSTRNEIQGMDSFTHSFQTRLGYQASDRLGLFVANNLNYFDQTGGESNNIGQFDVDSNDRLNDSVSTGFTYTLSERLSLGSSVGTDFSRFSEDNGSNRDRSQSNLFYSGNLNYTPTERTVLGLNIIQSGTTDIDGNRIIVRTAGLVGSYMFSDRLTGNMSGRFTQFDRGDSLSGASDRYEALASMRYTLTDAIALALGYSYVKQQGDAGNVSLFNSQDFDGHRAFVSLDTGFAAFAR